jgi:hypothetical protein
VTPLARMLHEMRDVLRRRPEGSPRLAHAWYVLWLSGWRVLSRPAKHVIPLPTLVRLMRGTVGPSAGARVVADARQALLTRLFVERSPLLASNCLERALVVHGTLAPAWPGTQLIVGFRCGEDGMHGHTWVVRDGVLQLEAAADVRGFVPAVSFDASGARLPGARTLPAA